jgi:CRP-like cAMP-binding protein
MEPLLSQRVEWEAAELQTGDEPGLIPPDPLAQEWSSRVSLPEQISYSLQGTSFGAILGRIESLAGLPPSEADELAQLGEFKRYAADTLVFKQGERIPGIFVVIRGSLKITRSSGRGKVQVLAILQPGTCVGEVQVFDGAPVASGAEALGNTDCWLIPAEALRALARDNAVVREVILRHFAGKVRHLIALVGALGLHSVPERVAQLLLNHRQQAADGSQVKFRETQEELAQRVGAGREAFSRSLRLLSGLGLIHSAFPLVRILDLEKLQRYAQG